MSNDVKHIAVDVVIIMGVSGSGKTTLAKRLAEEIGFCFIDADDYHSKAAKLMMENGEPLTESQRQPWVNRLCQTLHSFSMEKKRCVLAFSGLKFRHRDKFRELGFNTTFIFLNADYSIIESRITQRSEHFFEPKLLLSQFDDLELPLQENDVIMIDNSNDIEKTLETTMNEIYTD